MRAHDLVYLAMLLFLVLLIDWFAGSKAAFYFLLLVVVGVVFVRIDTIQTFLGR